MTRPSTTTPDRSVPGVTVDSANVAHCECGAHREISSERGYREMQAEIRRFVEIHRRCKRGGSR